MNIHQILQADSGDEFPEEYYERDKPFGSFKSKKYIRRGPLSFKTNFIDNETFDYFEGKIKNDKLLKKVLIITKFNHERKYDENWSCDSFSYNYDGFIEYILKGYKENFVPKIYFYKNNINDKMHIFYTWRYCCDICTQNKKIYDKYDSESKCLRTDNKLIDELSNDDYKYDILDKIWAGELENFSDGEYEYDSSFLLNVTIFELPIKYYRHIKNYVKELYLFQLRNKNRMFETMSITNFDFDVKFIYSNNIYEYINNNNVNEIYL